MNLMVAYIRRKNKFKDEITQNKEKLQFDFRYIDTGSQKNSTSGVIGSASKSF